MRKFSAQQVYKLLSEHQLTQEQLVACEDSSLSDPCLVIAGAGSGKTELMTVRILFLVANELARPDQILGLTFTKKAASELQIRVQQALFIMRESELWPASLGVDFEPPRISTYNSFGNEIFRRYALSVGYDPEATLLTEAGSVALANELLRKINPDISLKLGDWDRSLENLVNLTLAMASELTDNQADPQAAMALLEDLIEHAKTLPKVESGSMVRFQYTQDIIDQAQTNSLILEIAQEYLELKRTRNLLDFSDQVALALRALDRVEPDLDISFVMLDEYQDTSTIQIRLLAKLFSGMPVMAVGDPNQAIYGWRGASSANLENFHQDFGSKIKAVYPLSRSWRSGEKVVEAANLVSQPLATPLSFDTNPNPKDFALTPVSLVAGNSSLKDQVLGQVCVDEERESEQVASWLLENLSPEATAAVLFRTKAAMALFAEAIEARGMEVEITGLSGLLDLPEVIELISALKVIQNPEAGTHLMRILSGPKWRISPRDLASLSGYAKKLSRIRSEVNSARPVTIIEALDEFRRPETQNYCDVSETGFQRLKNAAELFAKMRGFSSLTISELAWVIARELQIDIELFAHSKRRNPLQHLEAFIARIADYEQAALRPSLSAMLSWLDQAMEKESFELPKSGAKKGIVQLMSVHAAKGLEWDLVCVVGLVNGSFPIQGRDAKGWLVAGKLPFALRGDAAKLPAFRFQLATTQPELKESLESFQSQMRLRSNYEERRLAYVAITRAKHKLLLTASYYKQGSKKPRELSSFFTELKDAGALELLGAIPEVPEHNPLDQASEVKIWPTDPLGARRADLEEAADRVQKAKTSSAFDSVEIGLLMEERERAGFLQAVSFPERLSASSVVSLLKDPEDFAKRLARPLPNPYSEAASIGTKFHADLENALGLGVELDDEDRNEQEARLALNFKNSRFRDMPPFLIEQEIHFRLAEVIIVCKIDAVFQSDGGYLVVDWKSGSTPKSQSDLDSSSIQLAIYRIALSKHLGIGVEKVRAAFFFAADGQEVAPLELIGELELANQIELARKAHRS